MKFKSLFDTSAYHQLKEHFDDLKEIHLADLFAKNPERAKQFSIEHEDFFIDFSKNRLSKKTIELFSNAAKEIDLKSQINDLFDGGKINQTENRAVLHTALRDLKSDEKVVDGVNIMIDIKGELEKIKVFTEKIHSGEWLGFTGEKIKSVVNIGIGGSDLGPHMVCEALKSYQNRNLELHFVSNVDPSHLAETLKNVEAKSTLFIVASKTFTTQETMTNAENARTWLIEKLYDEDAVANHFVALSTNKESVELFGIKPENRFTFWNWVGGRYSLWSSIGLPISLAVGYKNFERLLEGANSADKHFKKEPFEKNIPFLMAIIGVWYNNFFGAASHAILPYDQLLSFFPAYLQQADMESNGKSVDRNGKDVNYHTGPVIWGEPGTNGQHAFYQLIHQGTKFIPCDFIASANSQNPIGNQHSKLLSNYFAQTEALMNGKPEVDVVRELELEGKEDDEIEMLKNFKVFKGNNPTTSILVKELDPYNLGKLIAFYEHKIYVQGVFWNVFSFDQWGVELGKVLAKKILPELNQNKATTSHDSSTNGLINRYKKWSN